MGKLSVDKQSDHQGEDSQFCRLNEDTETCEENGLKINEMKLERFAVKPEQESTSVVSQLHTVERGVEGSLLLRRHRVDLRTPKHARYISFNKKELQRCLDFVEFSASDSLLLYGLETPCSISANPKFSKMKLLFDQSEPGKNSRSNNLGSFIVPCPIVAGNSVVVSGTAGQWIVGAVYRKINLNNILMSLLIRRFGSPDSNMKFGGLGPSDVKETNCSSSPSNNPGFGSPQLEIEKSPVGNQSHGSKPLGQRFISSLSYTKSAGSNQLSSPASTTVFQGILHCTWKSGIPHFVFSFDDHNEVFVAKLLEVESSDFKDLDYMYMFHTRRSVPKLHGSYNNATDLIGKMKVLKSSILCSNDSKLTETEFVLFGTKVDHLVDVQSSDSTMRKHKGSPKNVVELFRANHSFKHKATPKFGVAAGSALQDSLSDPCENMCNKPGALDRRNLLECPEEFELAAIVVKDHLREHCREATIGGWGLKFLEKARVEPADADLEASVSSGFFDESLRNQSDCSTSMNVIVPAGMHSGSRSKHGGPSSLTERWRSGGKCDCGGWDVGCPLTVLCSRLGEHEEFTKLDMQQDECKSCDLFKEGSNKDLPILRMAKIREELYVIHFQPTLSSLQAFSIGVANIHSQNKFTLCSKNVKKLRQQKSGVRIIM